ncbi:hypothetical protein HA402_011007 [Bradysia odoriphaga]|nr:hypothetical protein HA402_011007 [Bradysia odoriphaga]
MCGMKWRIRFSLSSSDQHQVYKWSTKNYEPVEVAKLPDDFFPTDLHWFIARQLGISSGSDSLLITSSDGRFVILNKNARVERNITAHTGCITTGRWSPDGAGLLTAGEDGLLKVWSRSGMLRSTVIQNEEAIRCARWSPNSLSVAYCYAGFIAIKPLAANSKLIKWRAHEGLVLTICWSNDTHYIGSGGEDCRYKIWEPSGTVIYASSPDDYPVTSIDFCPKGQLLAVGSFNTIKLCNFMGWAYSYEKQSSTSIGSLFSLNWSFDGTQIVAGSSSGCVLFGNVIEQELASQNLRAKTMSRKTIQLQDIVTKTTDLIDFPERIINWNLGFGHLVVATTSQVHVYNEKYINTPLAVVDGRNDVRVIILGKKYFLIVDNVSIWIYTYTGRLHLNPKYSGMQVQLTQLNPKCVSLGMHYIGIRNFSDKTMIHMFDLMPGASRQSEATSIQHKTNLTEISVCRAGNQEDQYIVFIDEHRDLFCATVKRIQNQDDEIYKIGTQVQSCMWGSESNILVGLHDASYSIWYCPGEACSDPTQIALTTVTFDTSEFGKNITLDNFEKSIITFRCSGAVYSVQIDVYCDAVHRLLADGMWMQALKVCRKAKNKTLWVTLAAISLKYDQLEISEEAYCASLQVDKVEYLQHIKELPASSPEQLAEKCVMMGRLSEAETILTNNKKYNEAVELLLRLHNYDRALGHSRAASNWIRARSQ